MILGSFTDLSHLKFGYLSFSGQPELSAQLDNLEGSTAVLTCDDGSYRILFTKPIGYTDFPLEEIKIYLANNMILLPGEY